MIYHQSLKTDQQRLDKIFTAESYNYWAFLKTKGTKTGLKNLITTFGIPSYNNECVLYRILPTIGTDMTIIYIQ